MSKRTDKGLFDVYTAKPGDVFYWVRAVPGYQYWIRRGVITKQCDATMYCDYIDGVMLYIDAEERTYRLEKDFVYNEGTDDAYCGSVSNSPYCFINYEMALNKLAEFMSNKLNELKSVIKNLTHTKDNLPVAILNFNVAIGMVSDKEEQFDEQDFSI